MLEIIKQELVLIFIGSFVYNIQRIYKDICLQVKNIKHEILKFKIRDLNSPIKTFNVYFELGYRNHALASVTLKDLSVRLFSKCLLRQEHTPGVNPTKRFPS
jgi:hypothetical protein